MTPEQEATRKEAVDILAGAVDLLHDRAAVYTHYEGWRLTEKELRLWEKVLRFLLRRFDMKDWDIIITLVALVMAESSKLFGYLQFRRQKGAGAKESTDKGDVIAETGSGGMSDALARVPVGARGAVEA